MKSNAKFLFPVVSVLVLLTILFSLKKALAEYQIYAPGASVTVGDFIYDDNYIPTSSPCSIVIADPSGNNVVIATTTGDSTGWHAYSFTPAPISGPLNGVWPAVLSCGSTATGDLVREDRSFIVGTVSVDTTTLSSAVASATWNSVSRTLTDYATSSIVSSVWNSALRTLTDYSTTSITTAIWSSPARTLTSFGTLVSDVATAVWGSGSRTLTAFGSLAADVWDNSFAPTRRLTDQALTSGGSIATQADVTGASSSIMTAVLANHTLLTSLNNISAADVWSYSTRTTTGGVGTVDLTASSTKAIWDFAKSSLTTTGSVGKLIADNLDAAVSSRSTSTLTAADVWLNATRTLSDYSTSTITNAVWSNGTRTLTNYGNNIAAADVWNVLTSSLTTAGSVGQQVAGVSTTTIASAVWNSPTRSLTDYATTTLAAAVWTSPTRALTSYGTLVSDITTSVWGNATRTLTAFGSLAADVWNGTYAPTRRLTDQALTSGGNIATQTDVDNASSTIMAAVLNNTALISNLHNIQASDVWAYGSRTLTGSGGTVDLTASSTQAIWNIAKTNLTTAGSVGKLIADNLDAAISSRSTSTLTAADIWLNATRTLSDYATSSVASAVWANATRSLTNYGNNISSADVWNTLSSTLTTAGSIGQQVAGVSTSTIAIAVWSNPTRNLTDYATSTLATAVWTSPTRSLTTFGTLVSDITTAVWGAGSRTLTAFGSLAADVWNGTYAPTRRLTDQTLTSGGNIATQTDVSSASSTIMAAVLNNATLINNLHNIQASDVWAYGSRTLTGSGGTVDLTASSTQAFWNIAKTNLTTTGSVGKLIADNLDATISSRSTSTLTAADVWAAATRTLTDYSTTSVASAVWSNAARTLTSYGNNLSAADVWNTLTSTLTTAGSVGQQVAGVSTSSIATAVWNNPTRNLTDYATSSIVSAVWTSPTRSLTSFGTLVADITTSVWGNTSRTLTAFGSLAADVWNGTYAPTRRLTDQTLTSGGNIATQTDVNNASSSIMTSVLNNTTLINNLHNIQASDVWAYGTRSLTSSVSGTVDLTASSTLAIWNVAKNGLTASGSVGQQIANNLDATISSRGTSNLTAADIWSAATRTLTDYSTTSVASAVWSNAARTLTNYGNNISAADVWNVLTSTLNTAGSVGAQVAGLSTTTIASGVWTNPTRTLTYYGNDITAADVWNYLGTVIHSGSSGTWTTSMSDTQDILAGNSYRAKVYVTNSGAAADSFTPPTITLYDTNRNLVVTNISMTKLSTGIYEFVYDVPTGAVQGQWESIVQTQVTSGNVIQTSDYWQVKGSPAQVIINSMVNTTVPTAAANVTITNEGSSSYEYAYEWCVVTSNSNPCGGGDDVFYESAAKLIQPGQNWNTTLNADVPTPGNYFFKVVVYYGTESSGSSRSFTETAQTVNPPPPPPPSAGGGESSAGPVIFPTPVVGTCNGADLNLDHKVNSVDFSILLYFWKTRPPFANNCVDMNQDSQVNSVDFSILLYQWGTGGIPIKKP